MMDTHLHHDHVEKHLKSSETITDIVIGMSDGSTRLITEDVPLRTLSEMVTRAGGETSTSTP